MLLPRPGPEEVARASSPIRRLPRFVGHSLARYSQVFQQIEGDDEYYIRNWDSLKRLDQATSGWVIARDYTKELAVLELRNVPRGARPVDFAGEDPEKGQMIQYVGNAACRPCWQWGCGITERVTEHSGRFSDDVQRSNFRAVHDLSNSWNGNSGGLIFTADGGLLAVGRAGACVPVSWVARTLRQDLPDAGSAPAAD
jgi:hypothetical protein